jgi:hypothetical protein
MATNPMQRQAREIYLEKKRADTAECVRRCRVHQAENDQSQSASIICEEATLVPTRSFDSTRRQAQRFSADIALKMARFTAEQL